MIDIFYDNMETIMETLFNTIYIFLWILYVNICFFKYNRRMQELEVEIVGLRRIVYAFMNDKTKLPHNKHHHTLVNKKNCYEIDEKIIKLKKGIMFLKKNMDELTQRIEILEHENTYSDTDTCSSTCTGDDSVSDGENN